LPWELSRALLNLVERGDRSSNLLFTAVRRIPT
jgi:hypothetical protein